MRCPANFHIVRSCILLGARQIFTQGFGIIGGLVLTQILSPEEYGMYVVANTLFYLCLIFGDLGLGASIVKDVTPPSEQLCRRVLAVRNVVDIVVLSVVCLGSCFWAEIYFPDPLAHVLVLCIALAAVIQSQQIIPTVLMERGSEFGRLAVVETLQTLVQVILLIWLSYAGYGIIGFGISWLGYAISGALLANLFHPWRVGWSWREPQIGERLSFSLAYQAAGAVSYLKDATTPIIVGWMLDSRAVGHLSIAQMIAVSPTLVLMILCRVYYPSFARTQGNRAFLGQLLETAFFLSYTFVAPFALILLVMGRPLIFSVFGETWLPASSYVYFFVSACLAVPALVPVQSLYHALGKSKVVVKFSAITTVLGWVLSYLLIDQWQAVGYASSFVLVQCANFWLVWAAKSELEFSFFKHVLPIWFRALAMGGALFWLQSSFPATSALWVIVYCLSALLFYCVAAWLSPGRWPVTATEIPN